MGLLVPIWWLHPSMEDPHLSEDPELKPYASNVALFYFPAVMVFTISSYFPFLFQLPSLYF